MTAMTKRGNSGKGRLQFQTVLVSPLKSSNDSADRMKSEDDPQLVEKRTECGFKEFKNNLSGVRKAELLNQGWKKN